MHTSSISPSSTECLAFQPARSCRQCLVCRTANARLDSIDEQGRTGNRAGRLPRPLLFSCRLPTLWFGVMFRAKTVNEASQCRFFTCGQTPFTLCLERAYTVAGRTPHQPPRRWLILFLGHDRLLPWVWFEKNRGRLCPFKDVMARFHMLGATQ